MSAPATGVEQFERFGDDIDQLSATTAAVADQASAECSASTSYWHS